ncbi:hypothetical protein CR513_04507, partial [Mucuna pruriens]
MCEQGYKKTTFDHYVFVRKFYDDDFIILLLYVDDMLIVWKSISKIDRLKNKETLVVTRTLLKGCCIHMENAKVVGTSLTTHFKLSSRHSPSNEVEKGNMSRFDVYNDMYKTRYCTC